MDFKTILISKKITLVAIATFLISLPAFGITVGVTVIKTNDSGLDQEKVSDFIQNELIKAKVVTVRNREAFHVAWEQQVQCKAGLLKCDDNNADLKILDILVLGDFNKHPDGYTLNLRAVSQKTYGVIYSGSLTGSKYENMMQDLASEMNDKFKAVAASGESIDQKMSSGGGYSIAIYKIKAANEAAQNVQVGNILDSILVTAFGKKGKFNVVESSRIKDIMNEKQLAMSGLVQTDQPAFEARGITHFLTGSLKVFNEARVLNYQIINVKTGLPIVSDMIEWTDENELKSAMEKVAEQSNETVFSVNGKLVIEACDVDGVSVAYEKKDEGSAVIDLGLCPLTVEDIPKGKYGLIFKHEDRDTLTQEVEVKAMETTRLPMVKMPGIDMTAFQKAGGAEASGKHQEAIQGYQAFYKRYPRHRMASYAMYREGFITQIHLKQFEAGRKILEEVIKRRPDYEIRTEAYIGIALGYKSEGKEEKSKEILKMLVEQYPGTSAADAAKECLDRGCPL